MSTTLVPPEAGDVISQRHAALRKAQETRLARVALLRRLGELSPEESCRMAAEMVCDPPDVLRSMRVLDFLRKVRRVSWTIGDRLLTISNVPSSARLERLTAEERMRVALALRHRAEFASWK